MPSEVANIRLEHVEAFLEDQLTKRSAATANNRYRPRGVLRMAHRRGRAPILAKAA